MDVQEEIRQLKRWQKEYGPIIEAGLWRSAVIGVGGEQVADSPGALDVEVKVPDRKPNRKREDEGGAGPAAVAPHVVGQLFSDAGETSISLVYDDTIAGPRVQQVVYSNPAPAECYIQITPPGGSPNTFQLPAATNATRNIPNNQRPLLESEIKMGWGTAPASGNRR